MSLVIAACSPSAIPHPAGRQSPTPAATASPSPGGASLLAVVEARGPGAHAAPEPGLGDAYDTVAIAGYDGYARARATFKPRQVPALPGGGTPVLPPPAVVAGGAVFFADGDGVVRRLDPGGAVTKVADFATSAQQELWFAVSPDGRRVVASVLTVPSAGGDWTLSFESATARGRVALLARRDLGPAEPRPSVVVGWDVGGPLVSVGTTLIGTGGWQLHGTALAHLGDVGQVGPALGGADCRPWSWAPDGSILCAGPPATVRDPAGNVLWTVPPGSYKPAGRALSPDASRVATDAVLIGADGWAEKLPPGFTAEGWADAQHLLGQAGQAAGRGHLEYVNVGDALRPHDLGFTGVIVGGVPAPPGVRTGLPSPRPSPSPSP